jgi:hypothetical protein
MRRSVKSRTTWRPPLPVLSIMSRCANGTALLGARPFLLLATGIETR